MAPPPPPPLYLIVDTLTMAIQVWRLWIIWSGTQYAVAVIILPLLLLVSYTALEIPLNIVGVIIPYAQLGISTRMLITMQTASYAALSGFTLLVTGLITARLLLTRRKLKKIMGMSETGNPYLSIVVMLVESYVLSSAWSLATTVTFAVNDPSLYLFTANDPVIQVIAYFLIVYRVANGKGWTKQTGEKLTTLQWNRGAQNTTEVSGIRSQGTAIATRGALDSPLGTFPDSAT